MPEVLEMPRSTQQDNREAEEREIRSRKEEAVYHFKQIKQASVLQSRNSLRIGYHAFALKEKNLWGLLGYQGRTGGERGGRRGRVDMVCNHAHRRGVQGTFPRSYSST